MNTILFLFFGIVSGFAISSGVFALITALSLIPRMADKTHTAKNIAVYETAVLYGSLLGNIIYFMQEIRPDITIMTFLNKFVPFEAEYILTGTADIVLLLAGTLMGIFVGTLAVSIAESLDVTAVFLRRSRLHKGLALLVLAFALGKAVGAFYFFWVMV